MVKTEKPEITQMYADRTSPGATICGYLRYLRFGLLVGESTDSAETFLKRERVRWTFRLFDLLAGRGNRMPVRIGILMVLLVAPLAFAGEIGWPVEIDAEGGWTVTLYQPQVDGMDGNDLQSRAAVSVVGPAVPGPAFGAVWISARLEVDRAARTVRIDSVEVPDVRFPEASDEGKEKLARLLEREIPRWDLEISLDRFIASLEMIENNPSVDGLKHDPPAILWSATPAVLVSIDGEPELRKNPWLRGQKHDILHVANSPFPILYDTRGELYYLYGGGELWYRSKDALGPWSVTRAIPSTVKFQIPEELRESTVRNRAGGTAPEVIVVTEPSELIVTDGEPEWAEIEGLGLEYMSNANTAVLRVETSGMIYVVLSGRWYGGRSTDGPWRFVPQDQVPPSFGDIPADSPVGGVRVHVAGTQEAREAVLDAQIPQTAAVAVDATIKVKYNGRATFEDIEGTDLQYAVNTVSQVIKAGDAYYCCETGVWYVSERPTGPWRVATEIPDAIYDIPPSNPNHNVTYVHVYDAAPEVVHVGYTSGYLGSYYYDGCTVYGTGWYYPGWHGETYYPRSSTWGFHSMYNAYTGAWGFGVGWSTGRFTIGVGVSTWGSPWGGGWWGVGGCYPYPGGGYYGGPTYVDPFPTRYDSGGPTAVPRYDVYARPFNAARVIPDAVDSEPQPTKRASSQANNVYSDRAGIVYRQTDDGNWERREGGSWKEAQPPSGSARSASSESTDGSNVAGRDTIEEDAEARRRGEERVETFNPGASAAESSG
jgi:hypothetical protein